MNTQQVDKLILSGECVLVRNVVYNETFTIVIVSRDWHTITTLDGGRFERSELEVVER